MIEIMSWSKNLITDSSIFDYASNLEGLQLTIDARLFQSVFVCIPWKLYFHF